MQECDLALPRHQCLGNAQMNWQLRQTRVMECRRQNAEGAPEAKGQVFMIIPLYFPILTAISSHFIAEILVGPVLCHSAHGRGS
jgi:hypothetical protein